MHSSRQAPARPSRQVPCSFPLCTCFNSPLISLLCGQRGVRGAAVERTHAVPTLWAVTLSAPTTFSFTNHLCAPAALVLRTLMLECSADVRDEARLLDCFAALCCPTDR